MSEIVEICISDQVPLAYVHCKVPQAVQDAVFVVDIKNADPHRDLSADDSRVYTKHWAIPENIHTPRRTAFWNSEGKGGFFELEF